MASKAAYPGVYVQEVPGGQHTITAIPTSIAAFVGRAVFGPVEQPAAVFSYGDFTRLFGGLAADYPMSYAVQDFFNNGGSQALIVRLFEPAGGNALLTLRDPAGNPALELVAANPGAWGNELIASVDYDGIPADADLFNLTIQFSPSGHTAVIERFTKLSVLVPARLDELLSAESALARLQKAPRFTPPAKSAGAGKGGWDSVPLLAKTFLGDPKSRTGIYALEGADLFNILCIPPDGSDNDVLVNQTALAYCVKRRAMLIVDPPTSWADSFARSQTLDPATLGITGDAGRNAAVYFPRIKKEDPARNMQVGTFPVCGIVAGVYARTDLSRGVWKAPAGQEAHLDGIAGLEILLNDAQNGKLNPLGINCLRTFPLIGPVVWGAGTLRGADGFDDDYKYVPVRRLALFIEESFYRGTKWAVFEPNDEALWAQLRLSVTGFMNDLFRQGAFYSFWVTCDETTTTQDDIANGIVNLAVGFAPVKPAEFLILQLQQLAGQPPS